MQPPDTQSGAQPPSAFDEYQVLTRLGISLLFRHVFAQRVVFRFLGFALAADPGYPAFPTATTFRRIRNCPHLQTDRTKSSPESCTEFRASEAVLVTYMGRMAILRFGWAMPHDGPGGKGLI